MNIAEDRTVVVEMVKRPSSFLQVLGGTGVFRERGLHVVGRGLGQPAHSSCAWGSGRRLQPRRSNLPSVTGSVSHRSRHQAIFRTCGWEGCVFGLAVLKNRVYVRRPEGTRPARPLPAVPSTQAASVAWWWPHCPGACRVVFGESPGILWFLRGTVMAVT